jgi:signal transduction histidine kinase
MAGLRQRIFVPTAVLAAIVGSTLAVLGVQSSRQASALEAQVSAVRTANALALALTHASQEEQRWILGAQSAAYESGLAEAGERVAALVEQVSALQLSPRAAVFWSQYRDARGLMLGIRDEILRAKRSGDEGELALALEKWRLASDRADALLTSFELHHVGLLERALSDLLVRRNRALGTAAAAVVVGVAIAVAFSVLLARAVVGPIAEMSAAARRIAELGHRAPVAGAERSDEIGVLARSFNGMTEKLTAANASLAEAVRTRDEFISIASHELKTPLTPMKLQLQALLRAARRDPAQGLSHDRLLAATVRFEKLVSKVAALVENMLDVSRLGSGKLALRVELAALPTVARDAVDRIADEVLDAGSSVQLEVDVGCAQPIPMDRHRMEQVVVNLVGNAAKYAPGSPIVVRCGRADGALRLEVEDRGPGIALVDHERIFNRFERAVDDPMEKSGLGLGLYIAREIVRAHGGELSVRSAVGEGATFVIELPSATEPVAKGGDVAS